MSSEGPGKGSGQTLGEIQMPSSGKLAISDVRLLRDALSQAEGDGQKLLPLITTLMRTAFHPELPVEIRNEAGRLLFDGGYFRVWQELLIDDANLDLTSIAPFSVAVLKDVAEKCLASLAAAVQNKDHLLAARLVGPLVYMVFRSEDTGLQTRLETFLMENPSPMLRLPALIHEYRNLKMPMLRMLQWSRYERLLIFDDLLSGDLSRRTLGKAILQWMVRAEKESGLPSQVVRRVGEALPDPEAMQALRIVLCPEYTVTREGIENQMKSFFSMALLVLPEKRREGFFEEAAYETQAKVKAASVLQLRDLYLAQGLMDIPGAAPWRLVLPAMASQVSRMVRNGRWSLVEAKRTIANFRRMVDALNQQLQSTRRTEPDFLYFPDPFAN